MSGTLPTHPLVALGGPLSLAHWTSGKRGPDISRPQKPPQSLGSLVMVLIPPYDPLSLVSVANLKLWVGQVLDGAAAILAQILWVLPGCSFYG